MAFSNIDNLQLGKFLQIVFSNGVHGQISEDFRDWEYVKRMRTGNPQGREIRFLFQNTLGPGAVQYRNPNFSSPFPTAQQSSVTEHSAVYKELNATVEIEYNLWKRAQLSPQKYAEPLAREMQSKMIALKRRLAADMYGDGTGVIGTASAVVDTTGAGGSALVTLSSSSSARGHIGFFEYGDLLLNRNADGTADNPTVGSGTFYAWRVKSKNRRANQVTLEAVDSSGTVLSLTASSIDSGDLFYRVGQPTIPDLSATVTSDYGTLTEVIAGLESLVSNDGRIIHGITMSGASAGTVVDCGGAAIDVSFVQQMMDDAKINVGQSQYSWKMLAMAPEGHAAFIESRETDRRFQTIDDNKRGVKVFAYVHGNDTLETYTSEYCPKARMYALPEAKAGDKVLEFHGTDFTPVKVQGGDEFHLKPSSLGGHERKISSYMEGMGVLICNRPAAIGKLVNFSV